LFWVLDQRSFQEARRLVPSFGAESGSLEEKDKKKKKRGGLQSKSKALVWSGGWIFALFWELKLFFALFFEELCKTRERV
jgi:hypothetical protein